MDLNPGETRTLQVDERDATGALVTRPITEYHWTSSAPDTVSVGAGGALRAHADLGGAAITVRSPSGLTSAVHAWVQLPEHVPSTYRITLMFGPDIPSGWRDVFSMAAAMLEHAIRAPLPPAALDGLQEACNAYPGEPPIPALEGIGTGTIIYVGRRSGGGTSTGGPCRVRAHPRPTSILGQVTIPRGGSSPGRPLVRLALPRPILPPLTHDLGSLGRP